MYSRLFSKGTLSDRLQLDCNQVLGTDWSSTCSCRQEFVATVGQLQSLYCFDIRSVLLFYACDHAVAAEEGKLQFEQCDKTSVHHPVVTLHD